MQVILLERIEKLGQMGDVVTVKPGFARNYLLPRKKALRASASNLTFFEKQKAQLEATNLKLRSEAEAVAKTMTGTRVIVIRQASEMGHLYGSVRSQDISEALTAEGFTVNRSQIQISKPVKTLGMHTVHVVLHPEVSVGIDVIVSQSEEEAMIAKNAASIQEETAA